MYLQADRCTVRGLRSLLDTCGIKWEPTMSKAQLCELYNDRERVREQEAWNWTFGRAS